MACETRSIRDDCYDVPFRFSHGSKRFNAEPAEYAEDQYFLHVLRELRVKTVWFTG